MDKGSRYEKEGITAYLFFCMLDLSPFKSHKYNTRTPFTIPTFKERMKMRKQGMISLKSLCHVKIKSVLLTVPSALLVFTCTDLGLLNFGLLAKILGPKRLQIVRI